MEHLFSKKEIYNKTNRKINFHVSLEGIILSYYKRNQCTVKESTDGQVKFCFENANRNLKTKFYNNRNVKFDTFQLFLAALDKKLGNLENDKCHDETEGKFDHELKNKTA